MMVAELVNLMERYKKLYGVVPKDELEALVQLATQRETLNELYACVLSGEVRVSMDEAGTIQYRDAKPTLNDIDEAFQELEEGGLIVRTGELRDGEPVFVAAEHWHGWS